MAACELYSQLHAAKFIGVPLPKPPNSELPCQRHDDSLPSKTDCHRRLVRQDQSSVTASRPTTEPAAEGNLPEAKAPSAASRSSNRLTDAGQPFRRGIVPGTTRSTPAGRDCLAANTVRASANDHSFTERSAFYSGHTPRLQLLKHLADHTKHRVTSPAARVLPALVMLFVLQLTWLIGCYPERPLVLCPGSRHGIVSECRLDAQQSISGGRTQKLLPYPWTKAFRRR